MDNEKSTQILKYSPELVLMNSQKVASKTSYVYFDATLCAFCIFYIIHESDLNGYHGLVKMLKYSAYFMTIIFSVLCITTKYKFTKTNLLFLFTLLFFPFYFYLAYQKFFLANCLVAVSAYNIPFRHIVTSCRKALLWIMGIMIVFSLIGIVHDRLYPREAPPFGYGISHDVGFHYYSTFAYLGMNFVICQLYLWKEKLTVYRITKLVLFSFIIFFISFTRLQLIVDFLVIGGWVMVDKVLKMQFSKKVFMIFAIVIFPLLCASISYLSIASPLRDYIELYEQVNEVGNGRTRLNEVAFQRYEITLMGNEIEMSTDSDDYFYIDCGYVRYLLEYGIIFTSLIMIAYSWLYYKIYKANNRFLFLWLGVYAIAILSNNFIISPLINPVFLTLFSDIRYIKS